MQIVIDIPEEIKQKRDAGKVLSNEEISTICMAIKNSTPLPKGHGRLIDADALEYDIATLETDSDIQFEYIEKQDVAVASTIIEADGGDVS